MAEVGYLDIRRMFLASVEKIRENHQELSRLDSATGDGDHGTTMVRSFDSVEKTINDAQGEDLKSLLYDIGWNIMCADGGSTGPLLGSLFMGMSESVEGKDSLDEASLAAMFRAGLNGMSEQSKANVGDKTMMDALMPAVDAMEAAAGKGKSPGEMLADAAKAAADGAEATTDMQAKFGRARNLGERTIGHKDPGATSMSLIFQAFAESI
ncbi:MAG: dihydroxyacetone kinase subunit L [Planctomycetes bacterium]|nr:dihydroxyacetone kinase subunit L [Planctomycetota bacterium]